MSKIILSLIVLVSAIVSFNQPASAYFGYGYRGQCATTCNGNTCYTTCD